MDERDVKLGMRLRHALRPRSTDRPGPLLRGLIMGGFGSIDAPLARKTMAIALGVEDERSEVFDTFFELCDGVGRGRVRLSDFMRACAGVQSGALWTPTRLDEASDPLTTTVRWKRLTTDEKRSVFAYFVTRFDAVEEKWDMNYDTFRSKVELHPRNHEELLEAYDLFEHVAACGVTAGQLLEIINNPDIDTFSDETDWIGGNVAITVASPRTVSGLGVGSTELAREAELVTAAVRACRLNRPADLETLVDERGLDVDARDETAGGQTLLMIAAANGNKAVCKRLLLLGASPTRRDHHGRTAIDIAKKYRHYALVDYLRSHGVPSGADLDDDRSVAGSQYSRDEAFSRDGGFNDGFEENDEFNDSTAPSAPPVNFAAFDAVQHTHHKPHGDDHYHHHHHHPRTGRGRGAHQRGRGAQHNQHELQHDAHEVHPFQDHPPPEPHGSHARESLLHMPD